MACKAEGIFSILLANIIGKLYLKWGWFTDWYLQSVCDLFPWPLSSWWFTSWPVNRVYCGILLSLTSLFLFCTSQVDPVSSPAIERRNLSDDGRPTVPRQWTVSQRCHHWFLPEVSDIDVVSGTLDWFLFVLLFWGGARGAQNEWEWTDPCGCLWIRYLLQKAPDALVQRCHIFSSFFYKQLTRRDNANEDLTSAL